MATFTYDKWYNGELLTAEGLNGAKDRPVLTITSDDFTDGSFIMEALSGLAPLDFVGMIVCRSDENGLYIEPVTGIYLSSDNNVLQLLTHSFTIKYQVDSGLLLVGA